MPPKKTNANAANTCDRLLNLFESLAQPASASHQSERVVDDDHADSDMRELQDSVKTLTDHVLSLRNDVADLMEMLQTDRAARRAEPGSGKIETIHRDEQAKAEQVALQILNSSTPNNAYKLIPSIMTNVFGRQTLRTHFFTNGTLEQRPSDDVDSPPLDGRLLYAIKHAFARYMSHHKQDVDEAKLRKKLQSVGSNSRAVARRSALKRYLKGEVGTTSASTAGSDDDLDDDNDSADLGKNPDAAFDLPSADKRKSPSGAFDTDYVQTEASGNAGRATKRRR